jgi:hypothetical protein
MKNGITAEATACTSLENPEHFPLSSAGGRRGPERGVSICFWWSCEIAIESTSRRSSPSVRGSWRCRPFCSLLSKSWALAALVAFGAGPAHAQGVTNVAMVTQIALTGVKQAGPSTTASVRITNKDILAALNATGRFDFASNAQLLLLSVEGQLPTFAVRERNGTNIVTADISAYFFMTEPLEVHSADHLTGYALRFFTLDNQNGTSFTVSGMTTLRAGKITAPGIGPLTRDRTLSSTVSGPGTLDGASIVVRGTVRGGSAKAEID